MAIKSWISKALQQGAPAGNPAGKPGRGRASATFAADLKLENISRHYGEHRALDGVDMHVAPGEIVCLLGPSGCGKTTLLRVVAGIEKPSGGRVLIGGMEVAGPERFVPPEKRSAGLMFQDFALFPHLTVLDNVTFGLKDLPREEARRAAMAVLARVGLESYASRYPHILSGGQQQRIALARAIVPRPAVMLMDEPFSGLDVQLRDAMQEETLSLLRETRATSVIVTHHPEEAMRIGDRIMVMRAGRIIQTGKAEELYQKPAALFVARLFSEINEIVTRVEGGKIASLAGDVPAPGLAEGSKAVLCIRERSITVARQNGAASVGLPGRVLDRKFLGDIARLEIAVAGFDAPLKARVSERDAAERGTDVVLTFDSAGLLVFSAEDPENNGNSIH